jgi:phosphoribosylformylglycinamidine synthase subunit PurS
VALVTDSVRLVPSTLWQHDLMTNYDVRVEVQLRAGVADPQGSTIERAIPTLGFDGVSGVRVGKSIRFTIDASDEAAARAAVQELCDRFLTNPVIEDSSIAVEAS